MLHHILGPRAGLPAGPVWRTVTVAARTCADANTASTVAVIGSRRAIPWLAAARRPARLVGSNWEPCSPWPAGLSPKPEHEPCLS